jgi:hypothetical protein
MTILAAVWMFIVWLKIKIKFCLLKSRNERESPGVLEWLRKMPTGIAHSSEINIKKIRTSKFRPIGGYARNDH